LFDDNTDWRSLDNPYCRSLKRRRIFTDDWRQQEERRQELGDVARSLCAVLNAVPPAPAVVSAPALLEVRAPALS
jgi:hypothetical protein